MAVKIFDGTQKTFGPFWFHLTVLLMTKDLLNVLMPEFKNSLPESENAERQSASHKQNVGKKRMVMGFLGMILTSPKWMIKVEKSKTAKWPSGRVYEVPDTPKKKCTPNDMLSEVEQTQSWVR